MLARGIRTADRLPTSNRGQLHPSDHINPYYHLVMQLKMANCVQSKWSILGLYGFKYSALFVYLYFVSNIALALKRANNFTPISHLERQLGFLIIPHHYQIYDFNRTQLAHSRFPRYSVTIIDLLSFQ
jgi:hypothetical protein